MVPSSHVVLLRAQLDKDLARMVEQHRGDVDVKYDYVNYDYVKYIRPVMFYLCR